MQIYSFLISPEALVKSRDQLKKGTSLYLKSLKFLEKSARKKLLVPIQTVTNKKLYGPSTDKHDYVSLAPYYWADPKKKTGLPYMRRDGVVNPERYKYDVTPLEAMTQAVRDLSFAYFFTQKKSYAKYAARMIKAWFIDPKTKMNPHLDYAQFVPGLRKKDGHGIIETVRFRWLIDNIKILENSGFLTEQDMQQVRKWFRDFLDWLNKSEKARTLAQKGDNKSTWLLMQRMLYSIFIGKKDSAPKWIRDIKKLISIQIEHDGRQPAELKRTRSLHYSLYNLEAFTDIAMLAKKVNFDVWNFETKDGRSIKKALDYLIPFVLEEKKWPHKQIDEPRYFIFFEILRRAAKFDGDPEYEKAIKKMGDKISYRPDTTSMIGYFDLIEPPLTEHK